MQRVLKSEVMVKLNDFGKLLPQNLSFQEHLKKSKLRGQFLERAPILSTLYPRRFPLKIANF